MTKECELPCLWCTKTVLSITGKQLHGTQTDRTSCSYKHMRKRAVHYQKLKKEQRAADFVDRNGAELDSYELLAIDSGYY